MSWDEDPDVIEVGAEEKQFTQRFLASGDKIGAALDTIVPPDSSKAVALREADKALRDVGVQRYIGQLMDEAGVSDLDIVKTLKRNLYARKLGIVQKTGEVVDIGEDNMAQIQAAKAFAQLRGFAAGGAKVTEEEKAPPKYELHFHNHEAPIDDDEGDIDDEDVIEGEFSPSTD